MRLYVYATERSRKATMALDCTKLTKAEAHVPGNVSLDSLQPGMIIRPAENKAVCYTVEAIGKRKDEWIIRFSGTGAGLKEDEISPIHLPAEGVTL